MRRNHKAVVAGAILVILCSCAAVLLLLSQEFPSAWGGEGQSSRSQGSSGVAEDSRDSSSGDIVTPSAVVLENEDEISVYSQIPKAALPVAPGCNAAAPQQGRDSLTQEGLQQLYDKMAEKVYRVSEAMGENQLYAMERITVSGSSLTDGQVVQVLTAFLNDHPEVFWISNQYGYSTGEQRTVVQLYSVIPASECQKVSHRMTAEIEKLLQKVPSKGSALDRETFLYEALIRNCRYDEEGASNDQDWRAHSIVGVFLDGEAVCEGYSRALQLLLNQCGIPSMVVTGTANGAHMWNLVRIDGQWYHADATWDDNGETPVYQYLNLTDDMISQDHQIYPQADQAKELRGDQMYNLPLPACTAVKANYFRAKGVPLTSSQDTQALADAICQAAEDRKSSIQLYIGEDLDYEEAVASLFQQAPYQFLYAVRQANLTAETPVDYNGCSYVEAAVCRGIVVMLSYEQEP